MKKNKNPGMKEAFEAVTRLLERVLQASYELKNENLWWRGQPKKGLPLEPKIQRKRKHGDEYNESNLILNFNQQARIRYSAWPEQRSYQLFLMQHYGLPTRLLDWSRSFLVALYFAVNDKELSSDKSSAIWALNPSTLNEKQFPENNTKMFHHNSPEVLEIINSAFDASHRGTNYVLALTGPEIHLRMFAQWSVFTIHASPISLEQLQHELQTKCLHEIEIEAEDRDLLKHALEIFGISQPRLFPDLSSLAEYLASKIDA